LKSSCRALLASTVVVAALGFCSSAGAALVTVGPDLSGTYTNSSCGAECTLVNSNLTQAGAQMTSPVGGLVVRWHVLDGETAGTYRLRTASPLGVGTYLFGASSAPVGSVPTTGVQTFTATMPIAAGQTIGIDMSQTASIGIGPGLGGYYEWRPAPLEETSPANVGGGTTAIGFNAEVQPAPTITALGTASGPTAGGTSLTITGTDLEGASAVSFGAEPASGFTVDSESQITAVAPAAAAGTAQLSVTTAAGKATSSQSFTYVAPTPAAPTPATPTAPAPVSRCIVPKLKGKKLKASEKALMKARCKVGTVRKKAGASARTGKVVKQSRTPGTVLRAGTKVTLTIKA
jgi:IPT/TIG domain/PASTA domain